MNYLVAAFSAFFLLVFVYTIWMASKQKDLDRRIRDLRRNIDRKDR